MRNNPSRRPGLGQVGTSIDAAPPLDERRVDAKLVENLGRRVVDQVADRSRTGIEARHRGKNHRPGLGRLGHQTKMAEMERCLTDHHDQFAALFQTNVGGSSDEIGVVGICHRAQSLYRAGGYHHPIGHESAGGDGGGDIGFLMDNVGHCPHFVDRRVRFEFDRGRGAFGNDQVGFDIGNLAEYLDQPDSINGSTRTRNGDDDPFRGYLLGSPGSVLRGRGPSTLDRDQLMTEISNRKKEHLDIATGVESLSVADSGWSDVHLVTASLPVAGPDDLDLSVKLAGCRLAAPLMIAGMTGGHPAALVINERLATVAGEMGIAVGSGSQRAALRDPSLVPTFAILRSAAPAAVIVANIGVCQLVGQGEEEPLRRDDILRVVDMLDAQLLAVHLNVLEELIQPGGDRNVTGLLDAIAQVVKWSPVPVVVKETGSGMSREAADAIAGTGAGSIDVGGAGGTSFARIEGLRASQQGDRRGARLGETFGDWGIPTAQAILEARGSGLPLIATGGVRSGLDAAKAIALGATVVGLGRPALLAARESLEALREELATFLDELRLAASLVGAHDAATLQTHRPVLTGAVLNWINQRGLTW